MESAPITLHHRLEPEDEGRAQFHALLARLYAEGPPAPLLAAIGGSSPWPESPGNPLAAAWNHLILASRRWTRKPREQEYTDLFIGVGRSNVDLHASFWVSEAMSERPLVEVRAELARLGLERREHSVIYEDHLSALCETMRILIAGDGDRRPAPVAAQRDFFERRIQPWVFACCNAICECPLANYYRAGSRIH